MVSIAIIGPGAVGGVVAGRLMTVHGDAVRIAARTPFDVLEVHSGEGVLRSTPAVLTDPADAQVADWVLVTTKAYDVEATAVWLRSLVGPRSTVAILQNGVEHIERFAPYVVIDQLLPVVVDLPAHRSGPGQMVQRRGAVLTIPVSDDAARFAELFAGTGVDVRSTDDFVTAAWRKLAFNATGAINAATLATRLDMSDPSTERLVHRTVEEVVAVGRAAGARLTDDLVTEISSALTSSTSTHMNSLHADRVAGRPMEIDARNGAVVRIGRRYGIPTPANEMLVDLLSSLAPPTVTIS